MRINLLTVHYNKNLNTMNMVHVFYLENISADLHSDEFIL